MNDNVIDFRAKARPVTVMKVAEQKSPPKLKPSPGQRRSEWTATFAQIWANPKNWKRSRNGNEYIVLDELGLCVVVHREETGFQWEIRRRDGDEPTVSRWVYMVEQSAIDDAFHAVVMLA